MFTDSNLDGIVIQQTDSNGLITLCLSSADPSLTATAANRFAKGCLLIDTSSGKLFVNSNAATPSFAEATQASENTVLTKTIALSHDDIIGMNATPIEIIAAPGAGTYIKVLAAVLSYTFDTAAYTDGGTIVVQYDGETPGTNSQVSITETTTLLAATDAFVRTEGEQVLAFEEDTAVVLTNDTGAFVDPGTAAGTASLKIYYTINTI